jgi:hypothetical protein
MLEVQVIVKTVFRRVLGNLSRDNKVIGVFICVTVVAFLVKLWANPSYLSST